LGQSFGGLGWAGSKKTHPRTTLVYTVDLHSNVLPTDAPQQIMFVFVLICQFHRENSKECCNMYYAICKSEYDIDTCRTPVG